MNRPDDPLAVQLLDTQPRLVQALQYLGAVFCRRELANLVLRLLLLVPLLGLSLDAAQFFVTLLLFGLALALAFLGCGLLRLLLLLGFRRLALIFDPLGF